MTATGRWFVWTFSLKENDPWRFLGVGGQLNSRSSPIKFMRGIQKNNWLQTCRPHYCSEDGVQTLFFTCGDADVQSASSTAAHRHHKSVEHKKGRQKKPHAFTGKKNSCVLYAFRRVQNSTPALRDPRGYVTMTTLLRGRMDEEEQTEEKESSWLTEWGGMWRCAAALFQKHLRNAYRTLSVLSGFDFKSLFPRVNPFAALIQRSEKQQRSG